MIKLPPVSGAILQALLNPAPHNDRVQTNVPSSQPRADSSIRRVADDPPSLHGWQLDGYDLLTVDNYDGRHDHYVDSSLLANAKDDDLCYFCTSPLSDGHVVRTSCGCGRIIHTTCFDRLLKYGLKCVRQGEQRPSIVRICGMCRRPLLGMYEDQHKVTMVAYRRFFRKSTKDRNNDLFELQPIVYSMKQIIKFVRLSWRSTTERNAVVSELLASLGHCFSTARTFSPDNEFSKHCLKMAFFASILSLRIHNNSNNLGTSNVAFVCDVIVRHQRDFQDLQFGRSHLATVFNYLFILINTTSDEIIWTPNQREWDKYICPRTIGAKNCLEDHKSAQRIVLKIFKSLGDVDPVALKWFRNKFYVFLLHAAKWGFVKDDDTSMTGGETGETKEDLYSLLPTRPMFEFILEHLDTFSGGTDEKIELLNKLKTVSRQNLRWAEDPLTPALPRQAMINAKLEMLQEPERKGIESDSD